MRNSPQAPRASYRSLSTKPSLVIRSIPPTCARSLHGKSSWPSRSNHPMFVFLPGHRRDPQNVPVSLPPPDQEQELDFCFFHSGGVHSNHAEAGTVRSRTKRDVDFFLKRNSLTFSQRFVLDRSFRLMLSNLDGKTFPWVTGPWWERRDRGILRATENSRRS